MPNEWNKPKPNNEKPTGRGVMLVGSGVRVAGTIAACERIVVDGQVEATLVDCGRLEVREGGNFNGPGEIAGAEIAGHYTGKLTVKGDLVLRATGRMSGTVTCEQIQIDLGGQMNGTLNTARLHVAASKPAAAAAS